VILAGVLLKMGTYGFIKARLPAVPAGCAAAMPAIMGLGSSASSTAPAWRWCRPYIKKIIAYSSISHLGYVMLGLASLTCWASRGRSSRWSARPDRRRLFLMVGMIYERCQRASWPPTAGWPRRCGVLVCSS